MLLSLPVYIFPCANPAKNPFVSSAQPLCMSVLKFFIFLPNAYALQAYVNGFHQDHFNLPTKDTKYKKQHTAEQEANLSEDSILKFLQELH